ncbi:MAG: VOC family protein [Thioalkalispiraceae bacterium]|jgi:glyoxylase I family protein
MIKSLLHASLIISELEQSRHFYEEVLGMERDSSRPDLGFPGWWFKVGNQQIHLLQLPNPDPVEGRPQHGGRDRHVAMAVDDIEKLEQNLRQSGVDFTRSRSGRAALFCRDPDGNALEFIEVS